jgi:hypothetical protein
MIGNNHRSQSFAGAVLLSRWCNIFGNDTSGAKRVLGGMGNAANVEKQWYCPTRAVIRCRMECEHGHRGQVMDLCAKHHREFRESVTFCPRCNQEPPGHKCKLVLTEVS